MKYDTQEKQLKMVWVDDVCLLEKVDEDPSSEVSMAAGSSVWLDIFCPQNRCEIVSASQLP